MTIQMHNSNNLILPATNHIELGNGLTVAEQRGKKDMMWGVCIEGYFKGQQVLYPVYAADPIVGTFSDKEGTFHIVKSEDVVMTMGQ